MKIESGKTYVNKQTRRTVKVLSVTGNIVTFNEQGKVGQPIVRSVQDFKLKHEVNKKRKRK